MQDGDVYITTKSRAPSRGPSEASHPHRRPKPQAPQKTIDDFWDAFTTRHPGKVHSILPKNRYAKSKAAHEPKGTVYDRAAHSSYDVAKAECEATVKKIARECKRVNMRYRDPHFDIEFDLKYKVNDCLEGLVKSGDNQFEPNSVKRIPEIFDNPQFYVNGATASDVRQGNDGDCWFLSALCALGNKKGLIEKICVARDEKVGVYGFVFHRDGEWIYTIIDDKLYLNSTDYDESKDEKFSWDQVFNRQDAEEEYRKAYQTGSRALYFAQCSDQNETWLPLLEKAFAKAHGDYRAICGGFTGEAIEDLTGGVTTELFTTDILDTDKFWNDEILRVNDEFLFGCATGCFDNWKDGGKYTNRKGIVPMHAYSIMDAREIDGQRLLRLRNPWGKTEWEGAWSDGSAEWTPKWMERLDHRFGNDGIFWISYKDLLRKYQCFDRTRLFGPEWTVTQQWTSVDVPWSADYNDTKFSLTLTEKGPIVIVLSQLDWRYWQGLRGQYEFSLHFRVDKEGEDGYIVRSHGNYLMSRSVSTDLELEPGTYSVLMKITATRFRRIITAEELIRENVACRQEKLLQIGLAYDLAHAKGIITDTEREKREKAEAEDKARAAAKQKQKQELKEQRRKEVEIARKRQQRNRRHRQKVEEHRRRKAEAGKAAGMSRNQDAPAPQSSNTTAIGVAAPLPEDNQRTNCANPNADANAGMDSSEGDITTQARIDQFNHDLDSIPAVQVNGERTSQSSSSGHHPAPPTASNESDSDSVISFDSSIDTDLDLTPLRLDDGGRGRASGSAAAPAYSYHNRRDSGRSWSEDSERADPRDRWRERWMQEEDPNREFACDPWNAVCVLGLRVYSRVGKVSVEVVRPKTAPPEESPLDLDDISKGVSDDTQRVEGAAGHGS